MTYVCAGPLQLASLNVYIKYLRCSLFLVVQQEKENGERIKEDKKEERKERRREGRRGGRKRRGKEAALEDSRAFLRPEKCQSPRGGDPVLLL